MPKFAANLSTMFTERPLLERFGAAREAGFAAVEIQFPYEAALDDLVRARVAAGVNVVLINTPPGDLAKGELGFGALPGRGEAFRAGVAEARRYASALGTRLVHVMAGEPGADADRDACLETFAENLAHAGAEMEPAGIGVLIEAINPEDRPAYFLNNLDDALAAITRAGRSNVGLLCDVYHLAMMGEDLIPTLARLKDAIGHVQFADMPGRHEPGTGGINFPRLFRALDAMGYEGWTAAEYNPLGRTEDSLGWMNGAA